MRRTVLAYALGGALAALLPACAAAGPAMLGFSGANADAERALEVRFDANLSADAIGARLKLLAAAPNQVGSPHDKANAEWVLGQLKSWGWDAHIETFQALYPTPITESLELVGPARFKASLTEPPVSGDATSAVRAAALPPYLIYGADGDVTADLVYVNYGSPADYLALARLGVDVKGKIVIVRYGQIWRGLKVKLAAEHGAVGCIIYSDPADDGFAAGDAYPKGAWRPDEGVQRGSILDIPVRSGDPLTPNVGATADAKRLPLDKAETLMKIPALPISYGDAQPFLEALAGQVAPKAWRGALPVTYHVGPGPARAHLVVKSDWSLKPLYDVIAVMPGAERPDEWVIRANHRDGWVFGAWDPLSGQAAMLEEARSIGALAKTGWKPKRTIVYASWDGEEPGLLGSSEWAEAHADELRAKGLLYVNSDSNTRGVLAAGASYDMQRLLSEAAEDVKDPETGVSAKVRAAAAMQVAALAEGATDEVKRRAREAAAGPDLPILPLGSGSDYTPFVQHLGVASINLEYAGEGEQAGVYHSQYDTFEHFARFGDPGMIYGVVLAETAGRLVLRTADADVAPLQFGDLAANLAANLDEVKKLTDTMRERSVTTDRLLDQHAFELAADPTKPSAPPPRDDVVPALDFAPLETAIAKLKASAGSYDAALAAAPALPPATRARLDGVLIGVERALTDPRGLPGRPWYVHLIYAPGLLTGYGSKTLPGVREAIEARRWAEAQAYIGRTAAAVDAARARIDAATAIVKGG
ncbi:MAG TPA: transferrin receptor-like dimerization domain-containing protein [Caulobacteraceae bacterium]|nr:transferrin receptor-like dimerization domain-containing protein [Caulobacteraceae bacterium]